MQAHGPSVYLPHPDLIVRGADHVLRVEIHRDGARLVPSAAEVTVFDAAGDEVVAGAAATVASDGRVTYTVTAATTADLTLGEGWRVEWTLTVSGVDYVARTDAALVRSSIYPVARVADLYARQPRLDPSGSSPIDRAPHHQEVLDDAWLSILDRLLAMGRRPNLVVSPSSFREPHVCLALERAFRRLASPDNDYGQMADTYASQYRDAWGDLRLVYDTGDTGQAPVSGRVSPTPTVWLN